MGGGGGGGGQRGKLPSHFYKWRGSAPSLFPMPSCQTNATILVTSQLTLPLFTGICAKGYASMEHCMNQCWECTSSIYSNRAVT